MLAVLCCVVLVTCLGIGALVCGFVDYVWVCVLVLRLLFVVIACGGYGWLQDFVFWVFKVALVGCLLLCVSFADSGVWLSFFVCSGLMVVLLCIAGFFGLVC